MRDVALSDARDWRVRKVLVHFSENLDKRIRLDRLAAALRISPRHLSRLFVLQTGETPSAKVKAMRLEHAAQLLLDKPTLAIKEVASSVGMQPARFSSQFRERFGVSPSRFRENGMLDLLQDRSVFR